MKSTDKPQLLIAELLKAAQIAQIDPSTIPSDVTPWSWKDSRAFAWQTAFRALNPAMAEQAEVAYGPAISLALQAALDGHAEMTPDLASELGVKRPLQHELMQNAQIESALSRMEENLEAERARRAEATPSPEELQRQLIASKEAAAAHVRAFNVNASVSTT
ncbi:hypothetical protein KBZ14_05925 [Synechococcus sp. HJ21-Hayes]|jgi:hypothetical protein|uniref:hypothetical protein n=1 Tax=unclassified Synechococcus TaxID=2626047 RepID=UPI0020CD7BC6|nr:MULTISPECIES: hypothetical protein [unclassified Synechococcus]MCP9831845.1 hypothetical protein [Synechococcus sp. JJ3a-Johnson]MCP9852408.1 hypothetical protein [Synechococcus sp. HJ21-Hayes]